MPAAAVPAIALGATVLGGAAAGVAQHKAQDSATKANKAAQAAALAQFPGIYGRLETDYAKALREGRGSAQQLQRAEVAVSEGTRKARGIAAGLGMAGRREIRRRETADRGRVRAEMLRRGLGASSVADQAQRAVGSDTARSLAASYAAEAGARAGIEERGGQALGIARGRRGAHGLALADLLATKARLQTQVGLHKVDVTRAVQHVAPSLLGQLGGIGGIAEGVSGLAGLFQQQPQVGAQTSTG